ncbi:MULTISPECIES: DUF2939 domain-containing protein [unclassified Moraxella]|uniref:DUF2939 domain-containing protein n=1 Tax=unclassified Moraxella TaxID=2685852 RepID=UPI003AF5BF9F
MKKIITLAMLLLIVFVGAVFASPYWTLYQLKNAYDAKDTQAITAHIDFGKLQQSLKAQLTPVLVAKVEHVTASPILQALNLNVDADSMVSKMVNRAVENTVTENGVNNLLNGQTTLASLDSNAKLLGGLTAVAMDKIDVKDLIMARSQDELSEKLKQQLSQPNPNAVTVKDSANYCGFNCFAVNTQVRGYPITVNMERQGFVNWKVAGVKLPI